VIRALSSKILGGITFQILAWTLVTSAPADDIDGVQPAALDQPRINVVIRRQPDGQALVAGDNTFNVEAFLDTGASSIDLSSHTAELLGIKRELSGKSETRFEDVGVGGGSEFAVSEPIFLSLAPMAPNVDVEQKDAIATTYSRAAGPYRTEIGPLNGPMDILTEMALGDMDIVGMPVINGKIIVLDPRDVNAMSDKIRTYVYDPRADHPAIPKTSQHVKLSFASFSGFTKTTPPDAQPPAIWANPFIGPSPLHPEGDRTPAIFATHHGKTSMGSWLLDTGAAASMISRNQAAALGVVYDPQSDGTDHPRLLGVPADKQFTLSVGGIGGTKKSAGFFLDKLSLPTTEGAPITFLHAPVLVADITVKDSAGRSFTLDGVFGMNFLVASAMVDESSLIPDVDHLTQGAFRWIVFDQPAGILGLERNP
jgi:hypothetical protein